MAEGQGISWGGMVKGAVKIAAIVTVGIGIVAGAGYGFRELAEMAGAADGSLVGKVGGVGTAILSGITGATEWVATGAVSAFDSVSSLFTSDSSTVSGEKALPELTAEAEKAGVGPSSEGTQIPGALPEGLDAKVDAKADAIISVAEGAESSVVGTAQTSFEAVNNSLQGLGLDTLPNDTARLEAIADKAAAMKDMATQEELLTAAKGIATDLNALDGNATGHIIDERLAELKTLEAQTTDEATLKTIAEARTQISDLSEAMGTLHGEVSDLVSTVDKGLGGGKIEIPNAPTYWAAAGAGVAGLGIASAAGRMRGQREGAWAQRISQERQSAARAFGVPGQSA